MMFLINSSDMSEELIEHIDTTVNFHNDWSLTSFKRYIKLSHLDKYRDEFDHGLLDTRT